MTSPDQTVPDGAYDPSISGQGISALQKITQADAISSATGGIVDSFDGGWSKVVDNMFAGDSGAVQSIIDGQLALQNSLDLLNGVRGYCSAFMSSKWNVKGGAAIAMPFNTQIGPAKGAHLSSDGRGITLESEGLWRADALISFSYMSFGSLTYQVYLSVRDPSGAIFTEKRVDGVVGGQDETVSAWTTFVVPGSGYTVYAVVAHNGVYEYIYGGTQRSALSVMKQDDGTSHAVVQPSAPDGGNLDS